MVAARLRRRVRICVLVPALYAICAGVGAQPGEKPIASRYFPPPVRVRLDRDRLQVFAVKPEPVLSEEEASQFAARLSSYTQAELVKNDEPAERSAERVFFRDPKDPSASLDVNRRTREVLFNKGMAAYRRDGDTPQLPGEEDAARLALGHLEKLGMLPPKDELVLAHVGGMNIGAHRADGSTAIYRKLVVVRYDRTLAGLPVFGDSRVVVRLAENGTVVGLIRRWLPVEGQKVRPEQLLTDDAIQQGIRARLIAEGRSARSIVVRSADLVMYDHGNGVIEPAIHVVANMHYEDKVVNSRIVGEIRRLDVPYDTFIPVLKNYKGRYPFMHDPEARKLIKTDQPPRGKTEE